MSLTLNAVSWVEPLFAPPARFGPVAGAVLISYALGCFTAGFYLVRSRTGKDIRHIGSGNVGAKNVSHVLGSFGFAVTLLLDSAKGMLAVWVARRFGGDEQLAALAMIAVVAGHIWPVQLRWRGGKGVATSLGALLVYDYRLLPIFGVAFAMAFLPLRSTVLAGMLAYALLPVIDLLVKHTGLSFEQEALRVVAVAIVAGLVLIAHRKNMVVEMAGLTGRRNGQPKPEQ